MIRGRRAGLLVLNAGLLAVVVGLWARGGPGMPGPSAAIAQEIGKARPRGQYIMVSGRLQGSPTNGIYVIDIANQELIALRWDRTSQRLQGLGWRDLARDSGAAASRGQPDPGAGGGR